LPRGAPSTETRNSRVSWTVSAVSAENAKALKAQRIPNEQAAAAFEIAFRRLPFTGLSLQLKTPGFAVGAGRYQNGRGWAKTSCGGYVPR